MPVAFAIDHRDLSAHTLRGAGSMHVMVDTCKRDWYVLDSGLPTPAVSARIQDGVGSDVEAATAIIRENQGG